MVAIMKIICQERKRIIAFFKIGGIGAAKTHQVSHFFLHQQFRYFGFLLSYRVFNKNGNDIRYYPGTILQAAGSIKLVISGLIEGETIFAKTNIRAFIDGGCSRIEFLYLRISTV